MPPMLTGIYGYPIERAAQVAVATVGECLEDASTVMRVLFCCFSAANLSVYERVLEDQHRDAR